MDIRRKSWALLVGDGKAFHISRNMNNRRESIVLHDHDFAEILWISEGTATHEVNGKAFILNVGDLVMILPEDVHQLDPRENKPFSITNVAFPFAVLKRIRLRYPTGTREWFFRDGKYPYHHKLDEDQYRNLSREFVWLSHAPKSDKTIDTFCLNLLRLLELDIKIPCEYKLPEWLANAMRRFTPYESPGNPPTLSHFLHLCGRCPEHVARVMREKLNTTPSAWVNEKRIHYAARLLEVSSHSILEVALECGFENIGYFHRIFKSNFGTTPRNYRKYHQRIL